MARAGPEVAVLRLLQAANPGRGGSGRAGGAVPAAELLRVAGPASAEAALVTPAAAGGSAPSCGERAGPGGAGVGLGLRAGATQQGPGNVLLGAEGRGRGDQGARTSEVLPSPVPRPLPLVKAPPGSTPKVCNVRLHQLKPRWSSLRLMLPARTANPNSLRKEPRGSDSGWGPRVDQPRPPA